MVSVGPAGRGKRGVREGKTVGKGKGEDEKKKVGIQRITRAFQRGEGVDTVHDAEYTTTSGSELYTIT